MSLKKTSTENSLPRPVDILHLLSKENYYREWLDSGVHKDLIALNVKPITGIDVFDLWYPNPDRRNDGRLTEDSLRKYRRLEDTAGWLVDGVDPRIGEPMPWSRYKPTEGEILDHQTGKPIKYLSPPGVESRLIYLRVSETIWQWVSERSGVPMPETYVVKDNGETPGFWPWVLENNVPIVLAEGEKKAGSLLTQGYAAISIPGIWNGRRNPKDADGKPKGEPFLISYLAIFDTAGRAIASCFDHDATPEKRQTTLKAAVETGKCFKNATVRIALLPGPQKGVDDFIVAGGDIEAVLQAAKPLEAFPQEKDEPDPELYADYELWESQQAQVDEEFEKERKRQWSAAQPDRARGEWDRLRRLTNKLAKEFCQRFLDLDPDTDFLPGINGLASPMGTGKTQTLGKIVQRYPEGNVFSYRNSLLQNLCTRIPGVDFIHDLGGTGNGKADRLLKDYSAWTASCIDSIFKTRPKAVLVLEEASKLIDHLLRGATCKRERAAILKRFREHIEAAEYIFLLDADLSDTDIRYIQSLAPSKPVHIIRNTYQPWSWQVNWYMGAIGPKGLLPNDRSAIIAKIIDSPAAGEIPIIMSDSQIFGETIHRELMKLYPDLVGLRVDSLTKADNPDTINEFLANPNKWIEENKPDYLILSPTAESSLDITIPYFTDAYAVFYGTISCYSMHQMLGRYRVQVPRHVSVKEYATKDNGGSKSPFAKTVAKHQHDYDAQTVEHLALDGHLKKRPSSENDVDIFTRLQALNDMADFESKTWKNPHTQAWSEYQARDNYQKANLRQTLREMLESRGHQITEVMTNRAASGFKAEKEEVLRDRARRIANSPDIGIDRALEIQRDMQSSSDDRFAAQKAFLKERLPGVTLTPDFIYWCEYKNRHILGQLQSYFMLGNPGVQEQRDRIRWAKALNDGTCPWDIKTRSLELEVLRSLGIEKFLDGKERDADDPEVKELHQRALNDYKRLKSVLNIKVNPDSDRIYLLRRLLEKIAVPLVGKQYREGADRYRKYRSVLPDADENRAPVLAA